MAVTQATIDTLHAAIEADGTLTNAHKSKAQSLLYALSVALFGSNAGTTITPTDKSGKLNGHLG